MAECFETIHGQRLIIKPKPFGGLNSTLNSSLLKTGSRKAKRDTMKGEQTDK